MAAKERLPFADYAAATTDTDRRKIAGGRNVACAYRTSCIQDRLICRRFLEKLDEVKVDV